MPSSESIQPNETRTSRSGLLLAFGSSRAAVASFFFLLAFLVRLYFVCVHPNFDGLFSVRGIPHSDSYSYVSAAITLARGDGLGPVLRPGLSILLALFYVWFGTSFHLISAINVLIGAATAALIYLVGERIFPRAVAWAAALFFVFDLSQLIQTPQATTESLGLMFFIGSVYCLLRFDEEAKLKPAITAGVLLALSNLTRPLTLVCAPFYAIQLVIVAWRRTNALRALLPACAFCIAIGLTMSPWLVRERLVHGIWTVSPNLGEALYAATSPKYQVWQYTVQAEPDKAGIKRTVSARYQFFMAESWKNLQRHPAFYAGQVSHAYWTFLSSFNLRDRANQTVYRYSRWNGLVEGQILFLFILATLLFAVTIRTWLSSGFIAGISSLLLSAALVIAWHSAPLVFGVIMLVFGIAVTLWRCRRDGIVLLLISLAVSGLGDAIFNNAILYRAVLMTDWIFSLFYMAAFYFAAILLTDLVLRLVRQKSPQRQFAPGVAEPELSLVVSFERAVRAVVRIALFGSVIFVLAGSIELFIINFGAAKHSTIAPSRLSSADKRQIITELRGRIGRMKAVLPKPETKRQFVQAESRRMQIVLSSEWLSPFISYFPAGTHFETRDKLFRKRPFDCSIFPTPLGIVVFPGRIPRSLREHQVVLLGWIEGVHPNGARFGKVIQCIAVIPFFDNKPDLDYEHAAIATPRLDHVL